MVEPTLSLHRKLAQILYEAERIPKRGKAPAVMGGYPFVQVGDAADYIRKALGAAVITMMPTHVQVVGQVDRPTKAGGTMTTVDLIVDWTFSDGESGETFTIQSFGAGADGGDKYSGKASTSAMKYAFLSGFLLSTGEDSELGTTTAERVAPGDVIGEPADGDSLIGEVVVGKPPCDLELRQTPDGPIAGFKLKQGRTGLQILAHDNLAAALHPFLAGLVDQRVSVWGSIELVPWERDGKPMPPYKRMNLARIRTPDFDLPGRLPEAQPAGEGPKEAPSAPLFDDDLSDIPEWAPA